ncbi:hydrogenase maturation nickel metallochaperone HypA [Streptomyces rubellomurinus]|uniref:Hydrogenase maturation factor HypA n=1 Tax=Streptomyces rubellomurinus (strain ATCC 31215) TaxID=359131 RepID=A0A0F2TE37_STRR3|nr:hydrogenase maturation nickel metallochaperone HypA [Streptomyces rubellomurinus]KJS61438.1 hydrogenase nickel incorporation protein HypA [Streptomyces rubellomurinus]
MHEMSIAAAIVEQVERAAREHGVDTVAAVRVQIGELAGVVPAALDFCFELACAETLLAGAVLQSETVPARARCTPCGAEWDVGMPPELGCPDCAGSRTELLTGRELQILAVEWGGRPVDARADQGG